MSENKLAVTELHKRYGDHEVLKGVRWRPTPGCDQHHRLLRLRQSTFLRCINFLEKPSEGSISLNNEDIRMVRDKDGQLKVSDKKQLQLLRTHPTMVFQHFNLWSHMTVLENVMEAPVQVLGLSKGPDAHERAVRYLDKGGHR